MPRRKIVSLAAIAAAFFAAPFAHTAQAQISSTPTPVNYLGPGEVVDFAGDVMAELMTRGARVAIVFRTGRSRDDLPDGISYTHGAFWVWSDISMADGEIRQGYVSYNLYHYNDDKLHSYLAIDTPLDFISGVAVEDVGVIIPTEDIQDGLAELIGSGEWERYHEDDYSLVSNPHDLRYQNCNEFMLDVVMGAKLDTFERTQIKSYLSENFEPAEVKVNVFLRLIAPMFDIRVRREDHDGRFHTVTYASMAEFMLEDDTASDAFVIEWDGIDQTAEAE